MLATKEQVQLMTQGLNFFARLDRKSAERAYEELDSRDLQPHQANVKNILRLAFCQSSEQPMWFPTIDWEKDEETGALGAPNSSNTKGGRYRRSVLPDTFSAITYGYIAEDGMIVLPDMGKDKLLPGLKYLPNVIVKNLSPDRDSVFYRDGIAELTSSSPGYKTNYDVWQGDSVDGARRLRQFVGKDKQVAILNMANAYTPGGGALKYGSSAQEEQLCYRSNLLPTLESHEQQGAYNTGPKKWGLNRGLDERNCDSGIFSPNISFFRDQVDSDALPHYGFLSKVDTFGIITSAAVDLRNQRPKNYTSITKAKIRFQLRAAFVNGFTNLILGAFGCGVFKGNPEEIATYYKQVFNESEFMGRFENIIFGIMVRNQKDQENLDAFAKIFPHPH